MPATALAFTRATKAKARLRLALTGPGGSGKTKTALKLAQGLAINTGKIALIDTERGSASKYSKEFTFDSVELVTYEPSTYTEAIKIAGREGYEVLIIDSLSHAWAGIGGALEQADKATVRGGGNKYFAWREVTPQHNALVDAILQSPCHVIATMRVKTDYQVVEEKGKMVPKRIGLAPIQRDGMEYEFDVMGDIDLDHNLVITKTRCEEIDRMVFHKAGKELADILNQWLSDGVEPAPVAPSFESKPSLQLVTQGEADDLRAEIEAATSAEALALLVSRIKTLPPSAQEQLRPVYLARRTLFAQ